jgi:hypothetical protein
MLMLGRAEIGFITSTLLLGWALATAGCGEENGVPPTGPPIVNEAGFDASRDSQNVDIDIDVAVDIDVAGDAQARSDRADVSETTDTMDVSIERETSTPEQGDGGPDGAADADAESADGGRVDIGSDTDGGPVTGPGCGGCFADELLSSGRCFTNASCGSPRHAVMVRENGVCRIHSCHPGWADCDGKADTGCEADLGRPENCTRCGNACPAAQFCTATGCVTTCAPPATDCSGSCVDLSSSPEHCTACFTACPEPQWHRPTCTAGVCGSEIICPPGAAPCGNACRILHEDPTNCGGCGRSCPVPAGGSVSCRGGTCVPHCPVGFTFCNDACVDVQADPAHCGRCNNPCATGGCVAGACDASWSQVIATGTAPVALAVDETALYWLEPAAGIVVKAPKAGGAPMTIATGQSSPFDLALDATHVYWSNRRGNSIMRIAKAGGSAAELVVTATEPMHLATDGVFVFFEQPPPTADAGADASTPGPPPVVRKVRIGTGVAEPFWEFPNGDTDSVLGRLLVDATNVYWAGRRYTSPGNYFTFLIDKELGATLRSYPGNWGELTMDDAFLYMTTGAGSTGVPLAIAAINKSNGIGGSILQFQPGGTYPGGGHMVAGDTYLYRSSPGEFSGVHKVLKCGLHNPPVMLTGMDGWQYLVTDQVYVYGVFHGPLTAQIRRVHR